jgi:S1-C subfamily serine protease
MTNRLRLLGAALLALAAPPAGRAQEDREAVRKTFEAVHASFVGIDIALRKKTRLEKAEVDEEALDAEAQRIAQLAENEQTYESWGVAVSPDTVLMADRGLRSADVEKIEGLDSTGARFELRLHAVGRQHDFVLLKPVAPRPLTPLAFADWKAPALGENFHVTYAERVDNRWHLNVSPYIQTNAPLVAGKDWFCIDVMRPGAVISDRRGATVGVALDQYLWVAADGRSSFLGPALLADEPLTDLEKRYAACRKTLPSAVKRVEISFRADKGAERYAPEEARTGRSVVFGAALDERGTLFVPEDLSRDLVRKIEDISVVDGGRTYEGSFVGSFRSFGGFLVRAEGLKTAPALAAEAPVPPPGALFFTARFEDRFGSSRINLDYNRVFRTERGLAGAARLQPRKRIRGGSFLLDLDGRITGCATVDRKEEDLDERAMETSRERYYMERYRASYAADHLRRLLFFREIAAVLANPAAHFDAKAVPMSKKDEKRLVWLGVEYQELSKPLAEVLEVQEREFTNDGRRGLLVTEVYAHSPAAKAGIQVDDILLSVRPEGEPAPRDLVAEPERFGGIGRGNQGFGGGSPRNAAVPPWKPTRNYLTSMLTEIGASKKASFELLRRKEKRVVSLGLELAPVDYETAERHKDDALGLTVKELTYEVRHFQRIEPELSGVLVARVESGSRADVARLAPLSIIFRVNDVPVRDLGHFRELVARAKSLTLTTISYGQTKLVEVTRE